MDLHGNLRVWLEVEDRSLVAHGWGGQRIEIPVAEIGRVCMASDYKLNGTDRREGLLVLNRQGRVMLRAPGKWRVYGDVWEVCRAAGLPRPSYSGVYQLEWTESRFRPARRVRTYSSYSRWFYRAGDYRRLRTSSLWRFPRSLVLYPLAAAVLACLGIAGTALGGALPQWFGEVRVPLGITGALLGATVGYWLCGLVSNAVTDTLRWLFASVRARRPGPPGRFFRRPGWPSWRPGALTAVMIAGMPALTLFGLIVALMSGSHGLSDSALVAQLRANGAQVHGLLKDDHQVHVDDKGNQSVTDTGILVFTDSGGHARTVTDPAVGGRPLPLDAADPARTRTPVTVVYLRDDPDTAAPSQEIRGSVWDGAPAANVTAGIVLMLLSPPLLIWRLVYRRRRQWRAGAGLVDNIASG